MKQLILGAAAILAFGTVSAPASAQTMQTCAAKYQAAKAANALGGQTWLKYLASCRKAGATAPAAATMAAAPAAPAAAAAPVATTSTAMHATRTRTRATTTTTTPGVARTPTANQLAERTRERACGAQWKAAKAANQIPAGQTWPQYWSACSKRMKGTA